MHTYKHRNKHDPHTCMHTYTQADIHNRHTNIHTKSQAEGHTVIQAAMTTYIYTYKHKCIHTVSRQTGIHTYRLTYIRREQTCIHQVRHTGRQTDVHAYIHTHT